MRKTRTLTTLLVIAIFIFTTLGPGKALAFVLNGEDWTSMSSPMGEDYMVFENTPDTNGELAAIQAAASTWNTAGADFAFTYGGPVSNSAPIFDGVNQIRWDDQGNNGILATAFWWFIGTDILETDCVFNDFYTWNTAAVTPVGEYDVETVMLHEFGHYLSLGHSVPPAVMQPSIGPGQQRRVLDQDDINGIVTIYGSTSVVGSVNFDWTWYFTTLAVAIVQVSDSDLNTDPSSLQTTNVTVTSTTDPTGITMTLRETGNNTGVFNSAAAGIDLGFTTGPSNDITEFIQVSDGDIVMVTYDDASPVGTRADIAFWRAIPMPVPALTPTGTVLLLLMLTALALLVGIRRVTHSPET